MKELTLEELTRFGIVPEDEGPHAVDPAAEWWNESWFWDWFDTTGEVAGHCRIGLHPNQQRAWVWFYTFCRGEWIALEEPRLPLPDVKLPDLEYDRWGLRFSWRASRPLRQGRLRIEGFGRVLSGARAGTVLPVGADLEVRALGAPHSPGPARARGHASETYAASRFEQPIGLVGTVRVDGRSMAFEGRGERDHSWGPRLWNMDWTVLVLNGPDVRIQCHDVRIPNVGRFAGGYLHRESTVPVEEVQFDLELRPDRPFDTASGRFSVTAEDGHVVGGEVGVISGAEIDITHTFAPPQRSLYRRSLIRVVRAGEEPLLGWLELNRMLGRGEG